MTTTVRVTPFFGGDPVGVAVRHWDLCQLARPTELRRTTRFTHGGGGRGGWRWPCFLAIALVAGRRRHPVGAVDGVATALLAASVGLTPALAGGVSATASFATAQRGAPDASTRTIARSICRPLGAFSTNTERAVVAAAPQLTAAQPVMTDRAAVVRLADAAADGRALAIRQLTPVERRARSIHVRVVRSSAHQRLAVGAARAPPSAACRTRPADGERHRVRGHAQAGGCASTTRRVRAVDRHRLAAHRPRHASPARNRDPARTRLPRLVTRRFDASEAHSASEASNLSRASAVSAWW